MQEEKKIQFSATGNLSDFMKKVQKDGADMYKTFAKEAAAQTKNQKEQYKIIKDQITALKEQLSIEKKITQEKLSRATKSYERSTDPTTEAFFKKRMEEQQAKLNELNSMGRAGRKAGELNADNRPVEKKESVFGAVLMAGLLRDIAGLIKQTANAKSELDLIPAAGSIFGTMTGGALGLFMSPATTQIGKEMGGFFGSAYTRSLQERERYDASALRVRGRTGFASQAGNMANFGFDKAAGAQLEESIVNAIARGTTTQQVRNVAAITKAFTMDTNIINSFLATNRMGVKANETMIPRLQYWGVNRAQFGDATSNITQMLQLMGQTTLTPHIGIAANTILQGNEIGGPFSIADPRSIGLLSQIHGNLVAPKTAFAQAMSYKVLRQQNPNASIVELLKKRQQGGPEYERGILDDLAAMTGSKDFATLAYSQNFGTGNLAADELRLQNKNKIKVQARFYNDLNYNEDTYSQAQQMTTSLQQSQAAVTNAFIDSFDKGIIELAARFTDRMSQAIESIINSKLHAIYGGSGGKKPDKNGWGNRFANGMTN